MILPLLIKRDKHLLPNLLKRLSNTLLAHKYYYRTFNGYFSHNFLNNYSINQRNTFSTSSLNNDHVDAEASMVNSAILGDDSFPLDLNLRQMCRSSHKSFLLYAYNHFDFDTIIKINNQVLAPYQTSLRKKNAQHRKQYLTKFLKCISKHHPATDHEMLARWLVRCMDLLTSHDMYSMLRVRYIMNYDNSFETMRSSHGIESLEKFSNVKKSKDFRDKTLEENVKNKSARRNLILRYLKINKVKFLRDQNLTKAVYEANIEWNDENINNKEMDESKYAFIYNLPYIEIEVLKTSLKDVLSKYGNVKSIEVMKDRVPPMTQFVTPSGNKNVTYNPKEKYSPLHAIVGRFTDEINKLLEFESSYQRNELCNTNLRVFGMLFYGRLIYPELAEYKHSLITAIYPPFKKMTGALQFIANTLVDVYDESNYEEQSHGRSGKFTIIEFSTCKITPFSRRRRRTGLKVIASAEKNVKNVLEEGNKVVKDNHIDLSMLEDVKRASLAELDPQWIVLRFKDFKRAYYARQKIAEQLSSEPRSFVSFDTKRSIFHNGRYLDLPLFRYSQDDEMDLTWTNLAKINLDME